MRNKNKKNVVMIADDDLFVRTLVKRSLPDSCDFVEVDDGADLVDIYKRKMPDILFLDVHLPNVNGIELLSEIKKRDKDAHIVMLTSDSTTKNVKEACQKGSAGFVGKPFTKKTLLNNYLRCPTINN